MLTLDYILRSRGIAIAGEIHGKPTPYPGDSPIIRKPRPKPQDEDFIKENEFLV